MREHHAKQEPLEREVEERRRGGVTSRELAHAYLGRLSEIRGAKPSTLRDYRSMLKGAGHSVSARNPSRSRSDPQNMTLAQVEPRVPFAPVDWREFQAEQPFDFVCLARSPTFTPPEADPIFDEIQRGFITEHASGQ